MGIAYIGLSSLVAYAQNLERQSFLPVVITEDFATSMQRDEAEKSEVMQRQTALLGARNDLSDRPAAGVKMSGGRKPVQGGCGSNYRGR